MKKHLTFFIPILVILFLFLSGCNSSSNDITDQQTDNQYEVGTVNSVGNAPILNDKKSLEGVEIRGGFIANSDDDSDYYQHENIYENEKLNIRYFIQSTSTETKEFYFIIVIENTLNDKEFEVIKDKAGQAKVIPDGGFYQSFANITLNSSSKPIKIDLSLGLVSGSYEISYKLYDLSTGNLLAETGKNKQFFANIHTKDPNTLKNVNAQSAGFLPKPNGFGFPNTGAMLPSDITTKDVARLLGANNVCYNSDPNNCILTARGTFEKNQYLSDQKGGQCYGFAVAAMMLRQGLLFNGKSYVSDYNSDISKTFELKKHDIANLIALKHLNQMTPEVQKLLNSEINTLEEYQKILNGFSGDDPIAALIFYDVNNDDGGHAVTPYAITQEENNKARIYVYDNNYPGRDDLYLELDLNSGDWRYAEGAVNAQAQSSSGYYGGIKEYPFLAIPLSLTQHEQMEYELNPNKIKYTLTGDAEDMRMFISQDEQHHIGYNFETGKYVNNIENTEEVKKLENMPSDYLLPLNPNLMDALSIESEEEFIRLLGEHQTVEVGALPTKEDDDDEVTLSMQASSSSFYSALSFDISLDKHEKFHAAFHPKGRMFFFEPDEKSDKYPQLSVRFDDNESMRGYIHIITFKDIPKGAEVAAFVGKEGEISIFAIKKDSDEFVDLDAPTHYSIKSTIIDQHGRQEKSLQTLSQPINSGMRLRPIYEPSGIQAKSKGQDVIIERIF